MHKAEQDWLDQIRTKIFDKVKIVRERSADKIPFTTVDGVHIDKSLEDVNWWTNGFWCSMQWMLYHQTGDERYKEIAKNQEKKMDVALANSLKLHHDVGMLWFPLSVIAYKVTGDMESRKRALLAANILAGRYNPVGKFIRAWNDWAHEDTRGRAIIDCMMNLPLLYWASEETKDPRYKQIAMNHADTTMNNFVRPDGSVHHIVEFDPEEGNFLRAVRGQGYEVNSSWSRGQAWAIYGFMFSYLYTGKQKYLDTAKKVAHYFIANVCLDFTPRVDFRAPDEPVLIDTTASAIAACGLIEISKVVGEYEKDLYLSAAVKLLKTLDEKYADWSEDTDNILTMCSSSYHESTHHYSIIYGDSFFLEAVFKLSENELFMW